MKCRLVPVAVVGLAMLAACAPPGPTEEQKAEMATQDKAAVDSLRDKAVAAENAGDAAAVAALWTDNGVYMPAHAPAAEGKAAIQAAYQAQYDQFTVQLTVTSHEVEVAGPWAFNRGAYSSTMTPKAPPEAPAKGKAKAKKQAEPQPIQDKGKWLVIMQRQQDGSWKIARLIFNSDLPLPGMGG